MENNKNHNSIKNINITKLAGLLLQFHGSNKLTKVEAKLGSMKFFHHVYQRSTTMWKGATCQATNLCSAFLLKIKINFSQGKGERVCYVSQMDEITKSHHFFLIEKTTCKVKISFNDKILEPVFLFNVKL